MNSDAIVSRARLAGVCYLVVIAGGLFAQLYVRGQLIVVGDAEATLRSIAEHESLWRWGVAVHLLYLVSAIMVNLLVAGLFRSALARVALVLALTGTTIEAMSLLFTYVPVAIIENGDALSGLSGDQRAALSYLAVRVFSTGFGFSLLFFGGFCVLIGVLILRSRLTPRVLGVLMIGAGVCYVVNTVAGILAPAVAAAINPAILVPCLLGELALALWLLIKGVATPR
jgi:hypothetical protein